MSEQQQGIPRSLRTRHKAQIIVDFYAELIGNGTIESGEKMPTIREMAKLWDVSQGVAARAVTRLNKENLVVTDGRRGTRAVLW